MANFLYIGIPGAKEVVKMTNTDENNILSPFVEITTETIPTVAFTVQDDGSIVEDE